MSLKLFVFILVVGIEKVTQMKDQNIAIAAGLIIVVVALGGLTIHNMQTKLTEKESKIDALESSVNELEDQNQRLEELVQGLEEELEISRNYTTTLESRLLSLIFQVINSTKTPKVVPRRPVFYIGDTVTFYIMYDFPLYGSSIKVWNPDEDLVWETNPLVEWIQLSNGTWTVSFYAQVANETPMTLWEMPVGKYTWSFVYDVLDIRGEFSVSAITEWTYDINCSSARTSGVSEMTDISNPMKASKDFFRFLSLPTPPLGLIIVFAMIAFWVVYVLDKKKMYRRRE